MLYLCMSVAGSIPVIICFILWLVQKESYDFRLGKRLLLLGMFFYLVPFQVVKHILPEWTIPILQLPMDISIQQDINNVIEIKSVLSPGESVWIPKWLSIVLIIWVCCVEVFAVYQIVKYRIDIRRLLLQSERRTIDVDGDTVELFMNKNIRSPYTVGFIKQTIIVPEASIGNPCFHLCYRHENHHRRNHDSFMKLICVIIICIHFLNPVAILLLLMYRVNAEYACDAAAVVDCLDDEKKDYARLLIELSVVKEPLSMVWRNNFSGSEMLMRRRICYIMKRKGIIKKGIAIVVTVFTVFVSTSSILAYEPFVSVEESDLESFEGGNFGAFSSDENICDYDFSLSDRLFIYEDGTQEIITDETLPKALCNHIMTSGYYSIHKPKSSGGCTVEVYNAQKCTRCGYLDLGSLYATYTYTVCPH